MMEIDEDSRLICNGCGSDLLHHSKIESFNRDCEDAKNGNHTTIENCITKVDKDMQGMFDTMAGMVDLPERNGKKS